MNLMSILKEIFRTRPSLDEFIAAHNPDNVYQVEELQRRYSQLESSSAWYN